MFLVADEVLSPDRCASGSCPSINQPGLNISTESKKMSTCTQAADVQHHQAAQKIHALSEPGSRRAHDLIDLQLIDATGELDHGKTLVTCKRLFSYRKKQS